MDFNTELTKRLLQGDNINRLLKAAIENGINQLLQAELTEYLNYPKHSVEGYNTGNSRNGGYNRKIYSEYGILNIHIPRDRNGEFEQKIIQAYKRNSEKLEEVIIKLYSKGFTNREIAECIEDIYGHHYSPTTVTNITKQVEESVKEFHQRKVQSRYAVIYADATYVNLRRDTVQKEAVHFLVGITPEGNKEILDYAIYPTESAEHYKEMLESLKQRGLKEVLLFITDGLNGIKNALLSVFPNAKYQTCWVHLIRQLQKKVRVEDKRELVDSLKKVYQADSKEDAEKKLNEFLENIHKRYPKVCTSIDSVYADLLVFFDFPKEIRQSIYTTNLIESLNKQLKKRLKAKEQFPAENSLDRYLGVFCIEQNELSKERIHRGFGLASYDLHEKFEIQ